MTTEPTSTTSSPSTSTENNDDNRNVIVSSEKKSLYFYFLNINLIIKLHVSFFLYSNLLRTTNYAMILQKLRFHRHRRMKQLCFRRSQLIIKLRTI